jgi:prolyl-tRNA editing enzyme YbaK/EbsC (Cys-tRNA(Pro) deacylase)
LSSASNSLRMDAVAGAPSGVSMRTCRRATGYHEPIVALAEFEAARLSYGEDATVYPLSAPATSVDQVSSVTGIASERLVKSLAVLIDDRAALVFVFGARRLSLAKLRIAAGAMRTALVPRQHVPIVTGYAPGDIPPIDITWPASVWLDVHRPRAGWIVGGGGTPDQLLLVRAERLYAETRCRVADISDARR